MRKVAVVAVVAGVLVGACGGSSSPRPVAPARIQVSSPAFAAGGPIPRQYTCDGRDVSPPLRWSGVPRRADALNLVMEDLDADDFIHWRLTGISAKNGGIALGQTPPGARSGRNRFGRLGYGGPCPPGRGGTHHYRITLTALSGRTLVARGTLVGTYARR